MLPSIDHGLPAGPPPKRPARVQSAVDQRRLDASQELWEDALKFFTENTAASWSEASRAMVDTGHGELLERFPNLWSELLESAHARAKHALAVEALKDRPFTFRAQEGRMFFDFEVSGTTLLNLRRDLDRGAKVLSFPLTNGESVWLNLERVTGLRMPNIDEELLRDAQALPTPQDR